MGPSMAAGRVPGARTSLQQLLGTGVAVAIMLALVAAPADAASKGCRVANKATGDTYARLQPAVRAARPGTVLVVRGTCRGSTAIGKRLVIRGEVSARGKPILHGDQRVRVLLIRAKGDVVLKDLVVRGGRHRSGAGITNRGELDLRNVAIRANESYGIHNRGVLRTWGATRVSRNDRGISNRSRLVLRGSTSITGNRYTAVWNEGTLVMRGTSGIGRNCWEARRVTCAGGIHNKGTVVMNDKSSISDGVAPGVNNITPGSVLVMNDSSSIHHNRIDGGVVTIGVLTMNDSSSIHHNGWDADESSQNWAGGVGTDGGTVTMNDSSSIHHNSATGGTVAPGGLGVVGATTLVGVRCAPHQDANVYGNSPGNCFVFEE